MTNLAHDVQRLQIRLNRAEDKLRQACALRNPDLIIDLIYDARNVLADLRCHLARLGVEQPPFTPPDPVAAEYFATHPDISTE